MNADIGYVNGGGIRADIPMGQITFNDILSVFPFNNTVVLAEVSGKTIHDMMEMAVMSWPAEDGSFPHLSGITFSVNTAIPSSVVLNENEEFMGVSGQYRVYDIKIFNRETEKYESLSLTETYTLSAPNYFLLECGSGMKMLENAVILENEGLLDLEALERYILEELGGVVDQRYADVSSNITFTEGELGTSEGESGSNEGKPDEPVVTEDSSSTTLIICISLGSVILLAAAVSVVFVVKRKSKR
jgi:2',3'-cyclic-nucleotide 2'-phosphodiesterase (5'-nucleotidase family)